MAKKHNHKKPKTLLGRIAEYLIGGTLYFWVGYGLFAFAFSVLGWNWFWAKVLGDVVGRTVNYIEQRYWTFSDTGKNENQHMGRYVTITIVSTGLDYAIVGGLTALGVTPYIGQLVSAAFFTVWNYLWFTYWVFPKPPKRAARRA